tara:strand:+ start:176 stop:319 length:144 start_codon:yes stop_codon:yes gene_type:complete
MNDDTMSQLLSTSSINEAGPNWKDIREQEAWDDFLAWCRTQENGPHE